MYIAKKMFLYFKIIIAIFIKKV